MLVASQDPFLSSELPAGLRTVDLLSFFTLLGNDRLVEAMVHVSRCGEKRCRAWTRVVSKFLRSNPYYPFEMLRAIVAVRDGLRW